MYEINLTSELLQSKEFDLAATTKHLTKTKEFLEKSRSDDDFEIQLVNTREISEDLGIPVRFESELITKKLKETQDSFLMKLKMSQLRM